MRVCPNVQLRTGPIVTSVAGLPLGLPVQVGELELEQAACCVAPCGNLMMKRRANAIKGFAVNPPSQHARLGCAKPVADVPLLSHGRKVSCRGHMTLTMLMHRNRSNDGRTVAGRQVRRLTARGAQGMG